MARHMHPSVSSTCSMIFPILLVFIPTLVHSLTLESDIEALQALKNSSSHVESLSYLDSWDFSVDSCENLVEKFLGILCSIPSDNSPSRITAIELDSTPYDAFLPPHIGNLTELTSLDPSGCQFRGPLPDTFKNLKNLTRLSLADNFFNGSIIGWIYDLRKLESIDLSRNQFSNRVPGKISRGLKHSSLSNNEFSGKVPKIRRLWRLQTLELGSNKLGGKLPRLPISLRTLSLPHNQFEGTLVSLVRNIQLRTLDLSDNSFQSYFEKEIAALPHLTHLNISFNEFSRFDYYGLRESEVENSIKASPLQEFDAEGNLLQGDLPLWLANFGSLEVINLANNSFTGPIPMEYGQRLGRPWKTLLLDDNLLSGPLPPQFNSSSTAGVRGSLGNNCLSCPENIPLCQGGQKPPASCIGRTENN
ncbi:hypothetical protein PTKIN_Ptkin09bG0261000 [Pterospermum kingtungense]